MQLLPVAAQDSVRRLQRRAATWQAGRGFTLSEALDRWEIGFAPEGWQNLWDASARQERVPEDLILGRRVWPSPRTRAANPMIPSATGSCSRSAMRAWPRHCLWRAGDGSQMINAKYLNSPETELFDKGRNLYNHGPGTGGSGAWYRPADRGRGLYGCDCAVRGVGLQSSVAPLGTASDRKPTADDVAHRRMNRLSRLDGDQAGLRAAMRVVDLALPLLEAGKSLRFAHHARWSRTRMI